MSPLFVSSCIIALAWISNTVLDKSDKEHASVFLSTAREKLNSNFQFEWVSFRLLPFQWQDPLGLVGSSLEHR